MKKYITLAALLTAGSAFANTDVALTQLTKIESGAMSEDGQFSVVLSLDVDAMETLLKAGNAPAWGTDIVTYTIGTTATGVTVHGGSNQNKILSSQLWGRWGTDTSWGNAAFTGNLAGLSWDDVTGIGLTYTFDKDNGTSVAVAFEGLDLATSYVTLGGLKTNQAGNAAITLGSMVKSAWLSETVLSADNAKAYAAAAAAIPEPSAFGLLAGLGALALVGTRRRRK